jgi:hypothetical protein
MLYCAPSTKVEIMSGERGFYFNGGVTQFGGGKSVKFLCFLLNGGKEISLSEARKLGFVRRNDVFGTYNSEVILEEALSLPAQAPKPPPNLKTTLPVVKIFLQENEFGKGRIQQAFYYSEHKLLDIKRVEHTAHTFL